MTKDLTTFDKIQKHLFEDNTLLQSKLSPKEIEILNRYKQVFTIWLQNPQYTDQQLIKYMTIELGLSKSQAYRDLPQIQRLLGNVRVADKEWYRYMVVDMCKKAFQLALKKRDPKAMAMAADKIGKYTKLDKDEAEALPWDEIATPEFEPSADVRILNIKPIGDIVALKAKLRVKYMDEITVDSDFEDVTGKG